MKLSLRGRRLAEATLACVALGSACSDAPSTPRSTRTSTGDVTIDGKAVDAKTKTALEGDIATLQKNMDTLKTSLGELNTKLERERDREGKLSKELLGDAAAGCWAKQPVNALEVTVNGAHLENGSEWETESQPSSEGSPAQFRYVFGDNFVYTNPDEQQNSLLRPGGKIVSSEFSSHRIGDIEYIKVQKGGYGVESSKNCWTEWLFFTKCRFKNWEVNRYRLDSLSISVSGQLLYSRENISYTFEGGSREWQDQNLAVNEAFLKLMGRNDCPGNP